MATYAALQDLGCDIAQGYLMAAPMPVDDLPGWVKARGPRPVVPVQRAARQAVIAG